MRYVMVKVGPQGRTWILYDAPRWKDVATVRQRPDGEWLAMPRFGPAPLGSSPSLAGSLIDAGFVGSVSFPVSVVEATAGALAGDEEPMTAEELRELAEDAIQRE